jgi:hypothetical protein
MFRTYKHLVYTCRRYPEYVSSSYTFRGYPGCIAVPHTCRRYLGSMSSAIDRPAVDIWIKK